MRTCRKPLTLTELCISQARQANVTSSCDLLQRHRFRYTLSSIHKNPSLRVPDVHVSTTLRFWIVRKRLLSALAPCHSRKHSILLIRCDALPVVAYSLSRHRPHLKALRLTIRSNVASQKSRPHADGAPFQLPACETW